MFRFTDQPPIDEGEKAPAFPAFRFDAGQSVYEEAVIDRNYVGVCYSALGAPAKRATEWARVQAVHSGLATIYHRRLLRAFELEVNGRTLLDCWTLDWVEQPSPELSRIHLSCTTAALRVTVCTRNDETEFIERWLEIENAGDQPLTSQLLLFRAV